jgi:hypothetical protein
MARLSHLAGFFVGALVLLVFAPAGTAQTEVSGRYKCTEMKIEGRIAPCDGAPLILKKDGHFELRGWEGDYRVKGEWLVLTAPERKSRAKIAPGHRLIFTYPCGKDTCEVTFERRVADLGKTSLG